MSSAIHSKKLNGLGDFVDRKRRRRLSQLGDDAADPRQHRLPIVHADAHVGEDALKRPDDFSALRHIVRAFDMQMDEAFARTPGRARRHKSGQPARGIALDHEHRMDQ